MTATTPTTIAGCFSLAAFAVAVLAGLAGGNPASSILLRAILALMICYPVGLAVGLVAQRLVSDHIEAHRRAHPAPGCPADDPAEQSAGAESTDEEIMVA